MTMNKKAVNCPFCERPAKLVTRKSRYRRGDRLVSVSTQHWECQNGCAGPDGGVPFQFEDPALLRGNDRAARKAWREYYGEEMPAALRPGPKPREARSHRIQVMLTESERQLLDRRRGDLSRSEYLRRVLRGAEPPTDSGAGGQAA